MTIDLSKYTHHGNFKLHSGQYSDTIYDVKEMICNDELPEILDYINTNLDMYIFNTVVGIESAGSIIAFQVYMSHHDIKVATITKDDTLIGKVVQPYLLIDDVTSTSSSIKKAIEIIGTNPTSIFVIIDRRKTKEKIDNIEVRSMFRV